MAADRSGATARARPGRGVRQPDAAITGAPRLRSAAERAPCGNGCRGPERTWPGRGRWWAAAWRPACAGGRGRTPAAGGVWRRGRGRAARRARLQRRRRSRRAADGRPAARAGAGAARGPSGLAGAAPPTGRVNRRGAASGGRIGAIGRGACFGGWCLFFRRQARFGDRAPRALTRTGGIAVATGASWPSDAAACFLGALRLGGSSCVRIVHVVRACRSPVVPAQLDRHVFVDRAGVGLLFRDAQFGQLSSIS